MLPLSPLRFSTIGKPILRTFGILNFFRFFDNSSRTRAKARAKARARAMARATARARRTRAKDRARARDGRTDGRTAGQSYLFSEMRISVLWEVICDYFLKAMHFLLLVRSINHILT